MTVPLRDSIVRNMQQKTTKELLAIVAGNDREEWSDEALDIARLTLQQRNVEDVSLLAEQPLIQPVKRYTGVRGWLLWLCISLTILNPLVLLASLGASTQSDMFHDSRLAFIIQEILTLALAGAFIYVGVGLWRVRVGAVKKAKILLVFMVVFNAAHFCLPVILSGSLHGSQFKSNGLGNMFSSLLWLGYLDMSKRVRATYQDDAHT